MVAIKKNNQRSLVMKRNPQLHAQRIQKILLQEMETQQKSDEFRAKEEKNAILEMLNCFNK